MSSSVRRGCRMFLAIAVTAMVIAPRSWADLGVFGCDGASVIPIFAKPAVFREGPRVTAPGYSRWRLKGEFTMFPETLFNPAIDGATVILSQTTILYQATLPNSSFSQGGTEARPRWRFALGRFEPDVPGALGWRRAKFGTARPGVIGTLNRVKFKLSGRGVAFEINTTGSPIQLRETIRVGDVCATAAVECEVLRSGSIVKCFSPRPTGSPGAAFLALEIGALD